MTEKSGEPETAGPGKTERQSNGEGWKGERAEEGTAAVTVSMSGRQRQRGMRCLLSLGL